MTARRVVQEPILEFFAEKPIRIIEMSMPRNDSMNSRAVSGLAAELRDMEAVLGVPCMQFALSALVACPRFLAVAWPVLRPAVDTGDFFQAAQRLQADAYTRMVNYFRIPDLQPFLTEGGGADELFELVELFQTRAALILLLLSLQAKAMDGEVGCAGFPLPSPERPLYPQIDWQEPPARKRSGQRVRHAEGDQLSITNSEYETLRRWPAFFAAYSNYLQSVVNSPVYVDWQHSTRCLALSLVQELPVKVGLPMWELVSAGLTGKDLAFVSASTNAVLHNLSGLLLNMAVARIGLEHGSQPAVGPGTPEQSPTPLKPRRVA